MSPLVIKLGSALLSDDEAGFDDWVLAPLARAVSARRDQGQPVVVVSSGAVALGSRSIPELARAKTMVRKQSAAAVGQALLMAKYRQVLAAHELTPAQLLLTPADLQDRERYLHACGVLRLLLSNGLVPIINENDVVSDSALSFGDNDRLAVEVASMVEADRLILMTVEDGVFDQDPRHHAQAQRLECLEQIDDALIQSMGPPGPMGCGGMGSKLLAARRAQEQGIDVVIASGRLEANWQAAAENRGFGTEIKALSRQRSARRDWIANTLENRGELRVDEGAVRALVERGASLLAVGLTEVEGRFRRGDRVSVLAAENSEPVGCGLIRLDRDGLDELLRRGDRVDQVLIHRDDLVLMKR